MELAARVLEHLRQKRCAVQLVRLTQDLRRPEPEVLAALGALRRQGLVQTLRPGEWEATGVPAQEYVPPSEAPAAPPVATVADVMARRPEPEIRKTPEPTPPAPAEPGETTMALKQCTKCRGKKGPRAFDKGQDVCRECKGAKPARKGTPKGNGAAGRFAGAIAALEAERATIADDLAKVDQAIEQLRAIA